MASILELLIFKIKLINFYDLDSFDKLTPFNNKQGDKQMSSPITSSSQFKNFNLATGKPTAYFEGLFERMEVTKPEKMHLLDIAAILDKTCFNKNLDHWRDNDDPRMSYDGAVALLDYELKNRVVLMPKSTDETVDVIMPQGILPTIAAKRMPSLEAVLNAGTKVGVLRHVVKDDKQKEETSKFINAHYGEMLARHKIEVDYIVANASKDLFEEGLKLRTKEISKKYILVVDDLFADTADMVAKKVLNDRESLGIASVPLDSKDWRKEMNLYGYVEAKKGNEKAAVIAFAQSLRNFITRNVFEAAKQYKEQASLKQQKSTEPSFKKEDSKLDEVKKIGN